MTKTTTISSLLAPRKFYMTGHFCKSYSGCCLKNSFIIPKPKPIKRLSLIMTFIVQAPGLRYFCFSVISPCCTDSPRSYEAGSESQALAYTKCYKTFLKSNLQFGAVS
jgi:hypothetical protein